MSKLLDMWADMTGVVLDYALKNPPSSAWLMCYGQALTAGNAATARLRAKLIADGNPHGVDGSGNPLVPDGRGRVFAGKDDMGGTAANRLTTAGAGINGATLGASGGAQTHALTTAQLAAHNHGVNDPGHGHSASQDAHTHDHGGGVTQSDAAHGLVTAGTGLGYGGRAVLTTGSGVWNTVTSGGASANGVYVAGNYTGISTQNNGSGTEHNNTQPTSVMNKIIKL